MGEAMDTDLIAEVEASPWEVKPAGEAAAIQAVLRMIEAEVRAKAQGGHALRDAHPKMHGCAQARCEVLDGLPADLRKGLFATPAVYAAWVRFSNGSGTPQGDAAGDGRGMAVKLMGVAGSRSGVQDFIMINSPAFFVRNAIDYVAFQAAGAKPMRFFFPGWNPFRFRLHELSMARAILGRVVSNPLDVQYWSMTPLLFGDVPCKVSARPVAAAATFADRSGPDVLRLNLARSLAAGERVFEFCVQRQADPKAMPVEDPTIVWSEARSPFIPVARLTLPRQELDTAERRAFGEILSFTPWHGLDAHRPLGGINRVRRVVYEAISRLRHDLNGQPRLEPTAPEA
jgi:hypothetical protein